MSSATPKIHLYLAPGACSVAVHILLLEAGAEFTFTDLSFQKGFPEEFFKTNPKGRVPVLVLTTNGKDEIITETPAIITAISQLFPGSSFLGRTPLDIVRSYEWMNWISGTVHHGGFGMLFRPFRWTTSEDEKVLEDVKSKAREVIRACFEDVEKKLEGRTWAVGEGEGEFGAVDAYLFPLWRWGNQQGFGMEENFPRYTALFKRVLEREAVKKALDVESTDAFGKIPGK
ncbi:glutathione S-transferase [Lophiostoma macrostomum CBS 122681]|uniref:Glutathione S-transferase n=1 Tax=Lophiostoma macrostomum CBS 122681 TaxID=1314788 RepID=A0A6A6SXW5_9PLEO|nr:glutathione S-transferase [Lophiostoma macrostomum CBS 122681]